MEEKKAVSIPRKIITLKRGIPVSNTKAEDGVFKYETDMGNYRLKIGKWIKRNIMWKCKH